MMEVKLLSSNKETSHHFNFQFFLGLLNIPANSINPDNLSLIKSMNGLSQLNIGSDLPQRNLASIAVAAAASHPSSLTSMKAF